MPKFCSDVRFILRSLRRAPGYAITLVVILALGIGATTALFGVLDQTVFRKPHPFYSRLVIFGLDDPTMGFVSNSYPSQILPCMEQAKSFESFAVCAWDRGSMRIDEGNFGVDYGYVNPGFFQFLGTRMALGRDFLPEEYRADVGDAVVITHRLWKDTFQMDPNILGRTLTMEGRVCHIVGVLPRTFLPPPQIWAQLYRPFLPSIGLLDSRHITFCSLARLRPGATLPQANAEVDVYASHALLRPRAQRMFREHPLHARPLVDVDPRAHLTRMHAAFMAAVACLFVIAILGAINLMSMRLSERRHELGVRLVLGASARELMCMVGLESLLLAGAGAVMGLGVAQVLMSSILNVFSGKASEFHSVQLDGRAMVFTVGLSVLSGLVVAWIPVWRLMRTELQKSLQEGGISMDESPRQRRFRETMVVFSAALAVVLLVGTSLVARSVQNLLKVDRGFDPRGKIAYWIDVPPGKQGVEPRMGLAAQLEQRLGALPGIRSACIASTLPLVGASTMELQKPDGTAVSVGSNLVSSSYARSLGLKLLKGRWLPDHKQPGNVMVINRAMARLWFGDADPIGRRLIDTGDGDRWEVIGLVSDVREALQSAAGPQYYYPFWQDTNDSDVLSLLVDFSVKPSAELLQTIRKTVREVDPGLGLRSPSDMEEEAQKQTAMHRFALDVLKFVSLLALALALLGLFAVMGFSVNQRMRSYGIRLALGASPMSLARGVIWRGLALASLGITLGLFAAWGLTRFIQSLLFEVRPVDGQSYVLAASTMWLAALAACALPARRAAKSNPAALLKSE